MKKILGQFFTNPEIVKQAINLIKNNGSILEPSAGDGAFSNLLNSKNKKVISIEYDSYYAIKNEFINMDFFDYGLENRFDTIIGNPPYVKFSDINCKTLNLINKNFNDLFDKRSNLYLFFIYKSILHLNEFGELIFITPKDFFKSNSSKRLNKFIYDNGTITDIIDFSDKKVFNDASVDTILWRFEKSNFSRKTNINKTMKINNGNLFFVERGINYNIKMSDIAYIKVGGVNGFDDAYENEFGVDFVCSYTNKTGKTKKLIYNKYDYCLDKYSQVLKTKHKKRDWWLWNRGCYISDDIRIYVNCKTRNKQPFF